MRPLAIGAEPVGGVMGRGDSIDGVRFVELRPIADGRGSLTPILVSGGAGRAPAQWNLVRSAPGVIRGVHLHAAYDEYYAPVAGRTFVFLTDARRRSTSFGRAMAFWIGDGEPVAITVPAGVAHGLAFPEGGLLTYGLSSAWTGAGEFGCRWDDPALGVGWPIARPLLSQRDTEAGEYAQMLDAFAGAKAAAAAP